MTIFERLIRVIASQAALLRAIAEKLEQLEIGGGGSGNASISDYESGKSYKRNALLVDPATETVYRVLPQSYVSETVETDKTNGYLKLVGFESLSLCHYLQCAFLKFTDIDPKISHRGLRINVAKNLGNDRQRNFML